MIQPLAPNRSSVLPGPAALRELARAFAHITDFRRFTEMLDQAIGKAGFFEEARIQLFKEAPPDGVFSAGQLTLPLAGRGELQGVLRVGGCEGERAFGPEDIHLLSALGAVISAAMDHALRHGELRYNLEIMSFVANLAPVGLLALPGVLLCAFVGGGRRLAAQEAACPRRHAALFGISLPLRDALTLAPVDERWRVTHSRWLQWTSGGK
jgi:hypothetical protein